MGHLENFLDLEAGSQAACGVEAYRRMVDTAVGRDVFDRHRASVKGVDGRGRDHGSVRHADGHDRETAKSVDDRGRLYRRVEGGD